MFYEPEKNDHGLPYSPFLACAAPRPIGWISTMDADGGVNLAPFSFFNALSKVPPYVIFSVGHHPDGRLKDSAVNAKETGEFVWNMATWDLREQMNETSAIVDADVDELEMVGLTRRPSRLIKTPGVAESPVQFECKYFTTVELPATGNDLHYAVIGLVIGVFIDDEMITGEGMFDILKARPLSRLGYMDYSSVESVFSMDRPRNRDNRGNRIAPEAAE